MSGEQYSTINKDTAKLVEHTLEMIKDLAAGKTPQTNSTDYNNGVKVVPTYLLPPELVTKANAAESYKNTPNLLALVKK